jgi:Tol biopolymer transport system component
VSKLAAIVLMLFAGLVTAAHAAPRDVVLVSRASGAAGAAAGDVTFAASSISANGRFVAFVSLADNLSDADDDAYSSVFVRDLQARTTTYVSRADGEGGEAAHGFAGGPSISADGRFVAFDSSAGNLSEEDDDRFRDVFVRDLEASTTTYVSRASDEGGVAGAAGDSSSNSASISADGRAVAFVSAASNLSDEDNDSFQNIYVRDLVAKTTNYVSRASDEGGVPGAPADRISDAPAISANGRFVVFESSATNLSEEDGNLLRDIFVRDLQARTTTLVSRASDEAGVPGAPGNGDSAEAAISADGRYVAFRSVASNLSDEDTDGSPSIFVRDLGTGTTTYVSGTVHGGALAPSISADGRRIAFQQEVNSPIGEIHPGENIFVRDLRLDTTTFVGRANPDPGETTVNDIYPPSISADGHHVAFGSDANSLSSEDNDSVQNLFARDLREAAPAAPATASPSLAPADTTGLAVSARSLTRANGTIRVSRRGRFRLFCGRFREPVTGTCGGRSAHRRALRLGVRSFTAPAGRRVMVGFRLPPPALRRLAQRQRVRMRGTLTARDALGNATTVGFRFMLKRAR